MLVSGVVCLGNLALGGIKERAGEILERHGRRSSVFAMEALERENRSVAQRRGFLRKTMAICIDQLNRCAVGWWSKRSNTICVSPEVKGTFYCDVT
jgi:hypothetical protein